MISIFPECYTKYSDQCTSEKADPEMFSFWVNNIFAEKQVLFDSCGLMQSQQSSYQSEQVSSSKDFGTSASDQRIYPPFPLLNDLSTVQICVEFVLAPHHVTSCDPSTTTKEDFEYGEETNLDVYRRIHKPNEVEH